MKKEKKERSFIGEPQYPGGPKKLREFIATNLVYPESERESGKAGVVQVQFSIDHNGKVIQTRVLHGLGAAFDEEAQRVVRLLRYEVPVVHGVKVQYHQKLNIRFQRPKAVGQDLRIQYQYTESQPREGAGKSHLGYTITWNPAPDPE